MWGAVWPPTPARGEIVNIRERLRPPTGRTRGDPSCEGKCVRLHHPPADLWGRPADRHEPGDVPALLRLAHRPGQGLLRQELLAGPAAADLQGPGVRRAGDRPVGTVPQGH